MGVGTRVNIAADGFDQATDVHTLETDPSIDIRELAGDVDSVGNIQRAINGVDRAGYMDPLSQIDGPVDGAHGGGRGPRIKREATVDGLNSADRGVRSNVDSAVDGGDIAGMRAGVDADRAVDRREIARALRRPVDVDGAVDGVDVAVLRGNVDRPVDR